MSNPTNEAIFVIQTLAEDNTTPLGNVFIDAKSDNGDWQAVTNLCGVFTPTLTYGSYLVTFSKQGYKDRTIGWNLNKGTPLEPILVGLERATNPFPNYPTREQVCNIFSGFQGITILTKQYGYIPAFGPECGWLNDDDCVSYCQQMKSKGFTHVEFDISGQYDEPSFQYPVPGRDFSQSLDEVCARIDLIIRQGMFIKFSLAGDGMSVNDSPDYKEYNDPQGWTYGFQWLMDNLARIIDPLTNYQGHDLTKFIIFVPGYDGVFYGWGPLNENPDKQPQRVIDFGNHFRLMLPNSYLGIEHTTGKIPVGESGTDWIINGPLDAYDTLLSEYDPFNLHSDNTWQIVGRLTRPYNRPPDQPVNDDPRPPMIMHDCSRGARFYIMYELFTYLWVRNEFTIEQNNETYDYFKAMAPNATLCMVIR